MKTSHVHRLETNIVKMSTLHKMIYKFIAISIKILNDILNKNRKNKPKIHTKPQIFLNMILRKKNNARGSIIIPDFKMYYKAIVSKMV